MIDCSMCLLLSIIDSIFTYAVDLVLKIGLWKNDVVVPGLGYLDFVSCVHYILGLINIYDWIEFRGLIHLQFTLIHDPS